jgi:quinol-cytochrome oxidoreductase complex cytochrome b subunit
MNWKMALKKRWLELLVAVIWMISAIVHGIAGYQTANWEEWTMSVCTFVCAILWAYIFYKRAKRDGA